MARLQAQLDDSKATREETKRRAGASNVSPPPSNVKGRAAWACACFIIFYFS